jgi:hypothetical protein
MVVDSANIQYRIESAVLGWAETSQAAALSVGERLDALLQLDKAYKRAIFTFSHAVPAFDPKPSNWLRGIPSYSCSGTCALQFVRAGHEESTVRVVDFGAPSIGRHSWPASHPIADIVQECAFWKMDPSQDLLVTCSFVRNTNERYALGS